MATEEMDKFRAQSMAVFRQLLAEEKYGSAQALALGLRSLVPDLMKQFQDQYAFKAHANGTSLVCLDNFEHSSVYIGKEQIREAYQGAPLEEFVVEHPKGHTIERLEAFLPLLFYINSPDEVEEFKREYEKDEDLCMGTELSGTPFVSQSFGINSFALTHIIREMDGEEL